MDDGRPKVAACSAVITVRTREVGTAWVMRSIAIALALCISLTVGGGFTVRAAPEPWSGVLDSSRALDWSHAGIPRGISNRATHFVSLRPRRPAPPNKAPVHARSAG